MTEESTQARPASTEGRHGLGRDFRLYAAGRAVSLMGDRISLITLVFLVVHLSSASAPAVALLYVVRLVPTFIGGVVAGVIVDFTDRKRLMIACDLMRAILLALVPGLAALDLWALYPMVFGLNALSVVFENAARAALPDVVPEQRMTGANAILNAISTAADLFYAVGGALVFTLGYRVPFFIDAGTFLFSAAMIASMRIPERRVARPAGLREAWTHVGDGVRYIARQSYLKWGSLTFAFASFGGGIAFVLTPLYANRTLAHTSHLTGSLKSGAFRFSMLEVSLGVGAVVGSWLVARLAHRVPRGQLFALGIAGVGVAYGSLSLISNFYAAFAVMACVGAFSSLFIVAGVTLIQVLTPSEMRGRAAAANGTIITAMLAAGSAASSGLLLYLPYEQLWALIGVIFGLASLFIWLRPGVRRQL